LLCCPRQIRTEESISRCRKPAATTPGSIPAARSNLSGRMRRGFPSFPLFSLS
jgi:hypothetical protein